MAAVGFFDRNITPDAQMIRERIGREVLPVWESLTGYLEDEFPEYKSEMVFYNIQRGWGIRYRKEAEQLCMLFPEKGAFSTLITLDASQDELAHEKINFFNARIRELLNQPSSLPQGRWLWLRLEDHTDFVGLKILLQIKSNLFD
jgi:hypothetical protein